MILWIKFKHEYNVFIFRCVIVQNTLLIGESLQGGGRSICWPICRVLLSTKRIGSVTCSLIKWIRNEVYTMIITNR